MLSSLKIGQQLGAGHFGFVFQGTIIGPGDGKSDKVAVKMVKSQTDNVALESLVSELKILIHLGPHVNVVGLIGASTRDIVSGK